MSTDNNHDISLQTAIDMTTLYRQNRPDNYPICETFEKDAIINLLNEDTCAFFRIYYGMKEDNQVDAILVGADKDGNDILPENASMPAASGSGGTILEDGYRCPEACPPKSPLNGG